MSRHVPQDDRVVRRSSIQIVARRMATLLEQRIVVPTSRNGLAWRYVIIHNPRLDLPHDVIDVVDVTHRRRVQLQRFQRTRRREEVAVGVDKARQQCPVPEIHHPRCRPMERHHVIHGSGGYDGLTTDRHRFDGWLIGIHRDDVVAKQDRIGGRTGVCGRSTAAEVDAKRAREDDDSQFRPFHDATPAVVRTVPSKIEEGNRGHTQQPARAQHLPLSPVFLYGVSSTAPILVAVRGATSARYHHPRGQRAERVGGEY